MAYFWLRTLARADGKSREREVAEGGFPWRTVVASMATPSWSERLSAGVE